MDKQNEKLRSGISHGRLVGISDVTHRQSMIYSFQCTVPHTRKKKIKRWLIRKTFSKLE